MDRSLLCRPLRSEGPAKDGQRWWKCEFYRLVQDRIPAHSRPFLANFIIHIRITLHSSFQSVCFVPSISKLGNVVMITGLDVIFLGHFEPVQCFGYCLGQSLQKSSEPLPSLSSTTSEAKHMQWKGHVMDGPELTWPSAAA